ncbi:hypothetical protein D3C73_681760 [compost metagenome]
MTVGVGDRRVLVFEAAQSILTRSISFFSANLIGSVAAGVTIGLFNLLDICKRRDADLIELAKCFC